MQPYSTRMVPEAASWKQNAMLKQTKATNLWEKTYAYTGLFLEPIFLSFTRVSFSLIKKKLSRLVC